jgi:hypothetical protein
VERWEQDVDDDARGGRRAQPLQQLPLQILHLGLELRDLHHEDRNVGIIRLQRRLLVH